MLETANSPLLIYVLLSFCIVCFVTYFEIELGLLYNWVLLCVLLSVFLHWQEAHGEDWDLTKHIKPRRIFAPVQNYEPLAFVSLIWFLILAHLYISEFYITSIVTELVQTFLGASWNTPLGAGLAVLKTHWLPSVVFWSLVGLLSLWHILHLHS